MDDLEELDFEPEGDYLDLWDENGIPAVSGSGLHMWTAMIEQLNEQADLEGWDVKDVAFLIRSPMAFQRMLNEHEVTVEEVALRALPQGVDPQSIELATGMLLSTVSELAVGKGGDLWGQTVPPDIGAVLIRTEVRLRSPDGELIIEDDHPVEARFWLTVTRSGQTFQRYYLRDWRTGLSEYEEDSDSTDVDGFLTSMVCRTLGIVRGSNRDAAPASPREYATLLLLNGSMVNMDGTHPLPELNIFFDWLISRFGRQFVRRDDPLLEFLRDLDEWAEQESTEPEELTKMMERGRPLWEKCWRNGMATRWTKVVLRCEEFVETSDDTEEGASMIDLPERFPHTVEHAVWAGEDLMALWAGASIHDDIVNFPTNWKTLSTDERDFLTERIGALGLGDVLEKFISQGEQEGTPSV